MKRRILNTSVIIFSIAFSCQNSFAQWTQKGQNIHGVSTGDNYGFAVSISSDGSTIATGAPYSSHPGFGVGHVQIYKYVGGAWTQEGQDLIGNNQGDTFGKAVSLNDDGSIVAISAPNNDDIITNAGIVNIYENIGGTWTQLGQSIVGSSAGDQSGQAISLSGDGLTVAIGTPSHASGALGQVRVYNYTGGNWVQLGSDVDGITSQSQLGTSVNLSNDGLTFVTGLRTSSFDTLTFNGSAKVFEYNGTDWAQKGPTIQGEFAHDNAGIAVDISANGDIVAVGANKHDANGSNAGQVRIFEYSLGSWNQIGQDLDGETTNNEFGASLSLNNSGSIVAIGAAKNANGGTVAGHTKIYENIGGTWIQKGADINGMPLDRLGWSVGLSGDGLSVVVGAPYNADSAQNAGLAKVYEYPSSVGINTHHQNEDIIIFPNPAKSTIALATKAIINRITIIDLTGKTIKAQNTSFHNISIADLPNGIYYVKVETAHETIVKKFIKK